MGSEFEYLERACACQLVVLPRMVMPGPRRLNVLMQGFCVIAHVAVSCIPGSLVADEKPRVVVKRSSQV